ncbi:MAG: exodeoxyribonuclease III [Lysobacter sp.]|nr:exodeoxyribonuclease III [Lysobacter sp.]
MAQLKIATFNVNGIRSRLQPLLAWLARERPDVACLQELKAPDEAFPVDAIHAAGYGAIWHGQRSWNGVAILARGAEPVESRRGLPADPDDTHSRYIEAAVHGVIVGCLYLPNGNPQPGPKFDYKLAWFERLIAHARTLCDSGHPVVLCGDYNVVPTDELDIYNPRSWRKDALLQPQTRECWRRLLAQGWVDALRALHPDEKVFTFWDYFRQHWERNGGLRIDHLLLNAALAPRLRDAGVDRWVRGVDGASDHAPTWVVLDAAAAPPARKAATKAPLRRPAKNTAPGKHAAKKRAAPAASGGTMHHACGLKSAVPGCDRLRSSRVACLPCRRHAPSAWHAAAGLNGSSR